MTEAQNSVCDRIGQGVRGQAMEVLEHVLHHITDVGMHYTFPQEWGLHGESRLYEAMQEAIQKGVYNVKCYREIDEAHVRQRVELQEFGYWLITTAWEFQAEFGHESREWRIRTWSELIDKLPCGFALFMDTVLPTLVPPKVESLRALAAFALAGRA